MYSSEQRVRNRGDPSTLDVNLNDYYGRAVPNCLDLSNSAFLDPLPAGAETPPGWPYVESAPDLGARTNVADAHAGTARRRFGNHVREQVHRRAVAGVGL